jgi:hypothetical protein
MDKLTLKKIEAYTVHSTDNDRTSSNKGVYRNSSIAAVRAVKAGWYGSDGTVISIEVWEDENGDLYNLKKLGKFTDEAEQYKENLMASIKSKLTTEELTLIGIKL